MGIFSKIFKSYSEKEVKRIMPIVAKINELEEEISKLTDEELKKQTNKLKSIGEKTKKLNKKVDDLKDSIKKMKKARPGAPAVFADTRAGVLNVPVPAAVSGQLHFPYAPSHKGKR